MVLGAEALLYAPWPDSQHPPGTQGTETVEFRAMTLLHSSPVCSCDSLSSKQRRVHMRLLLRHLCHHVPAIQTWPPMESRSVVGKGRGRFLLCFSMNISSVERIYAESWKPHGSNPTLILTMSKLSARQTKQPAEPTIEQVWFPLPKPGSFWAGASPPAGPAYPSKGYD